MPKFVQTLFDHAGPFTPIVLISCIVITTLMIGARKCVDTPTKRERLIKTAVAVALLSAFITMSNKSSEAKQEL